ncbi:MAG TPA: hypothetical protein VMZ29_04760 [Candidatus Bathyarchaeia archaeon]|nr:hypothetical protein [Candidatus Bathyarchaeia archaeon]
MKLLLDNLHDKKARTKSKKSIFTTVGIIAVVAVIGMVFAGATSFVGIILAAGILVAIVAGVYFLLRAVDDLPSVG